MMRSHFSGVAGLKTPQTKMDVSGNNISNVNTVAYKASTIVFADLMSQTTQRASGPNAANGTGGVNARQIGLGVKSGAININITGQGSAQSTGNPFDIMIEGENFFVVNNGTQNLFTRDGSFYVDAAGNLAMTSTGYNVMGWQFDETENAIKKDTVSALRIMSAANMTYPPEATTQANVSGIIDKFDPDVNTANGRSVNLNFFDSLGYSYTAKFVFKQSDDKNVYSVELDKILNPAGEEIDLSDGPGAAAGALFGDAGKIQKKAGKVVFDSTNYQWTAGKDLQSKNGATTYVTAAELAFLVDNGQLKAGNTPMDPNDASKGTVQDTLDKIAKAYGYEGSTDEFLKLTVTEKVDAPATPNYTDVTVETMLVNYITNATGAANPVLPTFTGAAADADTSFETTGRVFDGVNVVYDSGKGYFAGINGSPNQNTITLRLNSKNIGGDGNFEDIVIDFSETSVCDNKGTCTVAATSGDLESKGMGRRLGKMIGVSVEKNGRIIASYDSGVTKCLGQIATASFPNASGLEKMGDNMYAATLNSGEFDGIGVDITAGGGKMSTGQLEMSNVDLSSEFTEMITTQRGFQANSRIITVSDTLLEELTNLKR